MKAGYFRLRNTPSVAALERNKNPLTDLRLNKCCLRGSE